MPVRISSSSVRISSLSAHSHRGRSGRPIFVVCRRASLTRGSSPAQGNGVREVTNFSLAVIEGSGAGLDRVPVEAALESIFAEEGVSGAARRGSVCTARCRPRPRSHRVGRRTATLAIPGVGKTGVTRYTRLW